jgi:hypothetical protein
MVNIDQHDHSGGPTKGVPISSAGIADGSITFNKLNPNVADNATGIGTAGSLGANQLSILGLLKSIYQIATASGFISKNGTGAFARTITGTANKVTVTSGDGVAGNPTLTLPSTIYSNISFDAGTTTLDDYRTNAGVAILKFGGATAGTQASTSKYWRIGNVVFFSATIVLTVKGVNTGAATLEPLPFTSANDGIFQTFSLSGKINTYTAGSTMLTAELPPNSTALKLNTCGAANRAQLDDTNFANNDEFEVSGFYWVV